MGQAIFPTLVGLSWDQVTSPSFNTMVKRAVSGNEYRSRGAQYPLWTFTVAYDLLRDSNWSPTNTELQQLMGFYLARNGAFDSFLFSNSNDNTATAVSIGTGNASNTLFQLCRTYGAGGFTFNEPVENVLALTSITFNGVTQNSANYTTVSTGLITFNSAPGANVAVAWNGTYYYRCRFTDDSLDFNNAMRGLWDLQKLGFTGSVKNKV